MKLLTSTAPFLLLISLASVSCSPVKTIDYADGSVYIGEFRDGQRNGQGTHTFVSGHVYVGEFKADMRNGQETYTAANGVVLVGEFSALSNVF